MESIVHKLGNSNEYESLITGLELSDRLPIADNVTTSCLYEASDSAMRDIGFQVTPNNMSVALPLPVLEEGLTKEFSLNWTQLASEEVPMYFTQKFRQAISEYGESRGVKIEPTSVELAHLFIRICIRGMEVISQNISSIPSGSDAPTTLVLAMRSLMYHMFLTCASTTGTISPLYKLAYQCMGDELCSACPKEKHYWILDGFAKYFKYCALPETHIIMKDNYVRIIVKMMSRMFLEKEFIRKDNENKKKNNAVQMPDVCADYDPIQNWNNAVDIVYQDLSDPISCLFIPYRGSIAHALSYMYNKGKERSLEITETLTTVEQVEQPTEIVVVEQLDPIMNMIRDDMTLREILTEFRMFSSLSKLPNVVITMMEDLGFVGYQSMHALLVCVFESMILETNEKSARSVGYGKFCELMQ